jgi:hypothetical protein
LDRIAVIAADRLAYAEGQRVAGDEPGEGDDRRHAKRLGNGGDDVLAPDHAAVEQGETGQGH